MPKKGANISLSSYDDIFETDESRADNQLERVQKIPISELKPFQNHPFKVVDDEAMLRTTESIAQFGVLTPLIARPLEEGGYEIISGHRRVHAAEAAGLTDVPVIVRDMTDDEAVVLMVDSNLQRENILPSERAFAYKMKLEAMKHQGERTDLQGEGTSTQVVSKSRSNEILGMQNDQSRETVRRFIRLTNLIPELLEMLDQKQISFNPAVELSYLTPDEQKSLLEAMDYTQAAPSLSQAQRLKKLSQEGGCALDDMCEILGEVKKSDLERVAFKSEQLRKYFPKSYSPKQMQDTIIKLLEQWQKKRQRGMEL
jgi:ParB family chromosome partitioning protein